MAITAYTGIMGSGKTYEVVENVILPAILAGRRVVTNVAGLQYEAICAYLIEKFSADRSKLGVIVQVRNEQITEPGFFPLEAKEGQPHVESVVKGGDLLVVDECWRWWATGCRVPIEHMTFFRMHRHFVDPVTSGTCDIVLVVQDIGDLQTKVKVVVEMTYRMVKHKSLGSTTRYRVDVYTGSKFSQTTQKLREMQRKYNPAIFKLYKSYSQGSGAGKEGVVDKRGNIFRGALFLVIVPGAVVMLVVCFVLAYRWFHQYDAKSSDTASSTSVPAKASPSSVSRGGVAVPQRASQAQESDWRVKGYYLSRGHVFVLLSRGGAVQRLVDPAGFTYDGPYARGTYYDQLVSNYTGAEDEPRRRASFPGATK